MTFDTFWTLYKGPGTLLPPHAGEIPDIEKVIEAHARKVWEAARKAQRDRDAEVVRMTPAGAAKPPVGISASRWALVEAFRRQVLARILRE